MARLVRAVVLAKAMYGVEAAPPSRALMQKLASKILKCIGFRSKVKCNALAFDLAQDAGDLDPRLHILINRTVMIRRMVARSPNIVTKIKTILQVYNELGMAGSDKGAEQPMLGGTKPKGPVGLLLNALSDNDACLMNCFRLEGADSWPFNILKIPWQELKPRLTLIGRRARFREACSKRSELQCSGMIDHAVLDAALKRISEEDRCILSSALAQGRWMMKHASRMKDALDDTCKDYGIAQESPWHLLYICDAHKNIRRLADVPMDMSLRDIKDLPPLIRLGLPPLMGTASCGVLWNSCFDEVQTHHDNKVLAHFSTPHERNDLALQTEIQYMAAETSCINEGARDLADKLRQVVDENFASDIIDTLQEIHFPADTSVPEAPNVYTDGSVLNPLVSYCSIGTAGVVHVDRDLQKLPLNKIEESYGQASVEEHAEYGTLVKVGICLKGHSLSSTRAELAAVIIGLTVPWGVHYASDSQAMLRKSDRLLTPASKWRARPWSIVRDGDLWELKDKVLQWRRGAQTTKASWVKGHATEAHVVSGKTTSRDACLNDCADRTASSAHNLHVDLARICEKFTKRHNTYVDRLVELWQMYAGILKQHDQHVNNRVEAEQKRIRLRISDKCISLSVRDASIPVGCDGDSQAMQGLLPVSDNVANDQVRMMVWRFVIGHEWTPTRVPSVSGTTWVELLWLYLMGGGRLNCQKDIGVTCVKMCRALKEFRGVVKSLAAIGLTAANREIFSASHARDFPLQKLGIKSYLPSIRGYISVPQAIVEKMNLHITSFAHRLTPGKRKNLAAQDRAELTHVIWNSNKAMQWPAICHDDHDWLHADISNSLQYKQSEMQTFMLACPTCSFCQDVSRCRLWMGRVWNCLRCQQCGQRSSSSRWHCACGAPWSTCLTHRQQGFACGGESRRKAY